MRISTFFVSLTVHSLLVGGAVVARLLATDVLPEPTRATTFIVAAPEVPDVPPPSPPPRQRQAIPASSSNAAPVFEPHDIQPEPAVIATDAPVGDEVVPGNGDVIGVFETPDPPQPPPATRSNPVRIGGDIRAPQKLHHVAPEYPALARAARVGGVVILEALIAEDGAVRDVRVLRSVALLDAAAIAAVRQWRFTPTLLNGTPVPVIMTVTVAFNLK